MEKQQRTEVRPVTHIPVEPILTPPLVNKFPEPASKKMILPVVLFLVVALMGVGTGFVMAKKGGSVQSTTDTSMGVNTKKSVATETEAGINDEAAFPDTATGVLKEGGVMGEGTHHLDRTQTKEKDVSLSSTVINLQNFVEKKVEVRGQTISGKSGWLMDVGKVKVVQ